MTEELEDHMALYFVGARLSNQPSHAKDSRLYGDPSKIVRLGRKKGGEVERQTDRETADTLLIEWYRWSKTWRPPLGAPRVTVCCREYRQDEKHNDDSEESTNERLHRKEMEAVEYCVDTLPVPLQQAIGTEMRNREVKAKVWRDSGNRKYTEALVMIVPAMKKRGLFE